MAKESSQGHRLGTQYKYIMLANGYLLNLKSILSFYVAHSMPSCNEERHSLDVTAFRLLAWSPKMRNVRLARRRNRDHNYLEAAFMP